MGNVTKRPCIRRQNAGERIRVDGKLRDSNNAVIYILAKGRRKCLTITFSVTLAKILCCLLVIMFLTSTVVALSVIIVERKQEPVLDVSVCAACPESWIGFRGKCYYFSEETRNWTFSQTFCASMEASLAQFEILEELNFLKRYKGPSDHWIGLSRESPRHSWKWTDGTEHNNSFIIRGVGERAYLNDNGISSARIYTERKWICNKQNSYPQKCQIASRCK
ncbi:C-type lectin domain family 2 member D11 isoform X2 [Trichechus manatus latirostris]|uniref:C-type lectin domain family 2 member D11 isoform X2 n=1 Tax=Trichechus manatus latirostris TaxID=127582 RepID=A0A2Y9RQQ8_TRIMA|nr:C-type lectin domain family 2 member D11 isoform X2 [Trichechus manatus latirostris]